MTVEEELLHVAEGVIARETARPLALNRASRLAALCHVVAEARKRGHTSNAQGVFHNYFMFQQWRSPENFCSYCDALTALDNVSVPSGAR